MSIHDKDRDIRKIGGMPETEIASDIIPEGYQLDYERLHGTEVPGHPGSRIEILPPHVLALQQEILTHHPELVRAMSLVRKEANYDEATFYGCIFAYCGVVLDGTYDQEYLASRGLQLLAAKRNGQVVISSSDIAVIPKALLQ